MVMHGDDARTVTRIIGVDGAVTTVRCTQWPDGRLRTMWMERTGPAGEIERVYGARVPRSADTIWLQRLASLWANALSPAYASRRARGARDGMPATLPDASPQTVDRATSLRQRGPLPFT